MRRTQQQASARLLAEGFNDLPAAERRTALHIVGDVLRENGKVREAFDPELPWPLRPGARLA